MEFLKPLIGIVGAFVLIFLLCELGETVTNQHELLNDELCQCDWYLFSVGMQKLLVIFISLTQQPVLIRGFANIQCVRDTFKRVRSDCSVMIISYYIMF